MGYSKSFVKLLTRIVMAYLSKQTIVKSLQCIKNVETQVSIPCFSALQYFIAMDRYYRHKEVEIGSSIIHQDTEDPVDIYLDGSSKDAKKLFMSYVADVISFDDGSYLKSFKELYSGSKTIQGTIQSNFFGGSSVEISRNSSEKVVYPQQGDSPLIYALRGNVYRDESLYEKLKNYLPTQDSMFALAIWLLRRNGDIQETSLDALREKLTSSYTQLLVDTLLPLSDLPFVELEETFELSTNDTIASISISDFNMAQNVSDIQPTYSLQQIFYGAPGTGKSHEINRLTEGKNVIRTTFHPDTDYSTFVGCYKPHMEETDMTTVIGETLKIVRDEKGEPQQEKRIVYKYSCQAFLQAYIDAWQQPEQEHYLVIEEINRGNCAQIFGDIFQLLDRNEEGLSSYPIKTDADAENELRAVFSEKWNLADDKAQEIDNLYRKHYPNGITKDIKNGSLLLLPKNLYIWATMNTSDQSLFPIDSAFKRRWDWKYIKISEGRDADTKELLNWLVRFNFMDEEKQYTFECSWWEFIKAINEKIASATSSDDKKLGYFFCKPKTKGSKEIDSETFVGKVVFYLWNDVFKDEENLIFKVTEGKANPSFDAFYTENESGKTIVDTTALRTFMHNVFGEQSDLYTETEV